MKDLYSIDEILSAVNELEDKKSKKVKTMYKNLEYAPNYNPNHEVVKK